MFLNYAGFRMFKLFAESQILSSANLKGIFGLVGKLVYKGKNIETQSKDFCMKINIFCTNLIIFQIGNQLILHSHTLIYIYCHPQTDCFVL